MQGRKRLRKLFYENDLIDSNYRNGNNVKWTDSVGKTIKFIYDETEGYLTIKDYDKAKSVVTYEYNGKIYKQTSTALKRCQLGKMLFNYFKYEIGEILYDDNSDNKIKIVGRCFEKYANKQRIKLYQYQCLNCGFEGNKPETELEKTWCPCCCSSPLVVMQGINDIPTTDPWMIPYFQGGCDEAKLYTHSSMRKIYPICPLCKKIKNKAIAISQIHTSKSIGCSCGDGVSYPNKFMSNTLSQLNINFETEYSPDWISPKRFDFCIPSLKLIIEMDGGLGHGKNIFLSSDLSDEELEVKKKNTLIKDIEKDTKATVYGWNVIRVDSSISQMDYIKQNILDSELNQYFDFENIDWVACDEYATKNIVKELCDFYKQNLYIDYQYVSEKFHVSKCTVGRYLKKGLKFKWITDEQYKIITTNNNNQKTTYVYDLELNLLNTFNSATELIKMSEELYGIRFSSGGISKSIKEHRKYHNKFYVSYSKIESEEDFIKMIGE